MLKLFLFRPNGRLVVNPFPLHTVTLCSAVIGAGISGASSVFYLRQLFGDQVTIDIYEKGTVGGRLASAAFGGKEYESGGSIIHPGNVYMVNLTRMLGMCHYQPEPGRSTLNVLNYKCKYFAP